MSRKGMLLLSLSIFVRSRVMQENCRITRCRSFYDIALANSVFQTRENTNALEERARRNESNTVEDRASRETKSPIWSMLLPLILHPAVNA